MDRKKIEGLADAIQNIESEIDVGLRRPLLNLHGNNWQQATELLEDCRYTIEGIRNAETKIVELRHNILQVRDAIEAMHKEWQRVQALTIPLTMGDHVKAIIDEFLVGAWKKELLDVDDIRERLETEGVYLGVKNPAAVLSSMLARDKRLEWIQPGLYKKSAEGETQASLEGQDNTT